MNTLLGTPDLGTANLEHRDRVDFRELRRARTDRVFGLMDELGLDALILGREANARYATGVRRLWTSMSRAFVPTCFMLRAPRATHLLSFSASYEGIPEEIGPDHYFPVTWNPMGMVERFSRYDGASNVRRIGVDGMTPLFRDLLSHAFPGADLVGIDTELCALRRAKLGAEITCMRVAVAIAEAALVAAITRLRPGRPLADLQAAYLERMSLLGTSQFAQQGTFSPIGPLGDLRWITPTGVVRDGTAVALAGGALWAGYEGSLARTWWTGPQAPTREARSAADRWRDSVAPVIASLRPGITGRELLRAFGDADAEPAARSVHAVGIGHEGAIATPWLAPDALDAEALHTGMVVAVRELTRTASGGYLGEEMVLVTDDGPEVLTTLAHGPLAN